MQKYPRTKGRIPLNKRIAGHCLECAGSSKEVTLCHVFDCNLWPVRFGYTQRNKNYNKRMKQAMKYYSKDFDDLKKMRIDIDRFFYKSPSGEKKGHSSHEE